MRVSGTSTAIRTTAWRVGAAALALALGAGAHWAYTRSDGAADLARTPAGNTADVTSAAVAFGVPSLVSMDVTGSLAAPGVDVAPDSALAQALRARAAGLRTAHDLERLAGLGRELLALPQTRAAAHAIIANGPSARLAAFFSPQGPSRDAVGYGGALAAIGAVARAARTAALPGGASAYAPLDGTIARPSALAPAPPASLLTPEPPVVVDAERIRTAIAAYLRGDMAEGDEAAAGAGDEVTRTAIEWTALRLQPRRSGFDRIAAFLDAHPHWPGRDWLRARAEEALLLDGSAARRIPAYLSAGPPVSGAGELVLARQALAQGAREEAARLASGVWRENRFGGWLEKHVLTEFSDLLTAQDHRARSDLLFYQGQHRDSVSAAGRAGKAYYDFAGARVAVVRGADPSRAGAKIEKELLLSSPTWAYAQARRLRQAGRTEAAAEILQATNLSADLDAGADAWWTERRTVARRLLDDGDPQTAYRISAGSHARDGATFLDAEFYSGWIALRFLDRPKVARAHFARAARAATRPISASRMAYWQARAAEALGESDVASRFYAEAAGFPATYYGQLALARLGERAIPLRRAAAPARGDNRLLAIRVIDALRQAEAEQLPLALVVGLAQTLDDPAQISALAAILQRENDARGLSVLGRLASYRGVEFDDISFPTFGIPVFEPLAESADKALVYAIARQESAFRADAVSHAGARGLMQMLPATARETARRKGVEFDAARLTSDPAFNATLGAAHLGELLAEQRGSKILVMVAYNAGGGRVTQWVRAYGDPRDPAVDPVDWVERIPFAETRNYVQRVTENLGVYRALFGSNSLAHLPTQQVRALAARDQAR